MNKQDIALEKVHKARAENTRQTKAWNLNAIMCENRVKTVEKLIKNEERLYNDRIYKLKLEINRAIENAKTSHNMLDKLLKEKETLYLELKAATHFGQKKCEYCLHYFTPQGIQRHKAACAMKPEIKIEKEHKEEVTEIKEDLEAKKAALQKQLADLEKAEKG